MLLLARLFSLAELKVSFRLAAARMTPRIGRRVLST